MEDINKDEECLVKLLIKIQKKESQLKLLQETGKDGLLLHSRIISSILPKVGIKFNHDDLEEKKKQLKIKWRKEMLQVAIESKHRELTEYKSEFESKKTQFEEAHGSTTHLHNRLERNLRELQNISTKK